MNQFTFELLEKKFKKLSREHSDLLLFPTLDSFIAEFEGQGAKPSDAAEHRVTRIDATQAFESGNVRLVEVPLDSPGYELTLAKYSYPTV